MTVAKPMRSKEFIYLKMTPFPILQQLWTICLVLYLFRFNLFWNQWCHQYLFFLADLLTDQPELAPWSGIDFWVLTEIGNTNSFLPKNYLRLRVVKFKERKSLLSVNREFAWISLDNVWKRIHQGLKVGNLCLYVVLCKLPTFYPLVWHSRCQKKERSKFLQFKYFSRKCHP